MSSAKHALKVVIIVQARMGSSRLPGKILKEVLGKPLLSYEIERLKNVKLADELLIATTTNSLDQTVVDLCFKEKVVVFRGSEEDVLLRYHEAAKVSHADVIVRLTADCPLIDPKIVDEAIHLFLTHHPNYDYLSNVQERTYPRGMDVEVFSRKSLEEAFRCAKVNEEREHVTLYFYRHPEKFRIMGFQTQEDHSHLRLTVDTSHDFALIRQIIEHLYPAKPRFSLADILKLLKKYPDWCELNRHVKQKEVMKD